MQTLERVFDEPARDARVNGLLAAQRARDAGREAADRVAKRERRRDCSHERVVHRVEHGVEALRGHDQAFLAAEPEEARLPGEAVGVQGPAEVEQYAAGQWMRSG